MTETSTALGLTDSAGASAILKISERRLRSMRAADLEAIARGEEPTGPRWIKDDRLVRYSFAALNEWIAAREIGRAA